MSKSWKDLMKQADLLDNGSLVNYTDVPNSTPTGWTKDLHKGTGAYGGWEKPPCFETHPVVQLGNGTFIGGSCTRGTIVDADVRVGLDWGMKFSNHHWPWETEKSTMIEFLFEMTDGSSPKNPKDFLNMIQYLAQMLEFGKTVNVGCIGGHGRTGMVLTAIVALMYKAGLLADAPGQTLLEAGQIIQWVRKHYCHKAVENPGQVEYLMKHFGVAKASGSRWTHKHPNTVKPAPSPKNIWGKAGEVDTQEQLKVLWELVPGELASLPSVAPGLSDEPVFAMALAPAGGPVGSSKTYELFWHDLLLSSVEIKNTKKGFVPIEKAAANYVGLFDD